MSEVHTDSLTDEVTVFFNENTEASIHNHPSGLPPSIKDIFSLINMNQRSNGKFESSFIVPRIGPIYVLYIENAEKALDFLTQYDNNREILQKELEKNFFWLISNGGGYFPEREFYGYALTGILDKFDSGISLLQLAGNGGIFKQMETKVETEGDQIIRILYTICK